MQKCSINHDFRNDVGSLTSSSNSYRRVANVLRAKNLKKFEWPPRIELEMRKDTQFFTTDVCRVVLLKSLLFKASKWSVFLEPTFFSSGCQLSTNANSPTAISTVTLQKGLHLFWQVGSKAKRHLLLDWLYTKPLPFMALFSKPKKQEIWRL